MKKITTNRFFIIYTLLILISIGLFIFVSNNQNMYKKDIAKVKKVENQYVYTNANSQGYRDDFYNQKIELEVMNNEYKGEIIEVTNEFDQGLTYLEEYKKGDIVFVATNKTTSGNLIANIEGYKRDKEVVLVTILMVLTLVLIGRLKGFTSLLSVIFNIGIFLIAVELNAKGINLVLTMILSSMVFCIVGLILASGFNKCTLSAIISSLLGLTTTMIIALIVMNATNSKGIRFDQLQLLTRPYKGVFISELLVGGLGAIMDISITITSSFKELISKNQKISKKELTKSGIEIGKDVTGTMINVLFFTFISGAIPTLSILFRNSIPLSELSTEYISLEMVRALTGAIGITITIPIAIFVSILLLRRKSA